MKKIIALISIFFVLHNVYSQQQKTDANVIGHVICEGEHIPFVNIQIKGTTMGTATDETGHYQLINVPVGEITIIANAIQYKQKEITVVTKADQTVEVKFELEPDILGLEEVVVSADRNSQKRVDAPIIVNTIAPELFATTQSISIGEGLNFCPGLRMENNCQNCGFSQIRMNGMEGPYSQILINSRPIFSGLAGVYGLELIPANMIERIEVVRGGGSALYGGNAIAGTINLILKDPIKDSYEFEINTGLTGIGMKGASTPSGDYNINLNASVVSDDNKTGLSVYGFNRNREAYDANDDGYSELVRIKNTTIGSRLFHRFGYRSKMIVDFFNINEERRGGNKLDYLPHEAEIAESLAHNLTTGALTYEQFFRKNDLLSIYASGQYTDRDSYYGANYALDAYGHTSDFTYNMGAQYKSYLGNSTLVFGADNTGGKLYDKKLGYPDESNAIIIDDSVASIPHTENSLIVNQTTHTLGAFVQYEFPWRKFKFSLGARYDNYQVKDRNGHCDKKTGQVLSPKVSVMYNLNEFIQARLSYSNGYRAPQVFDEDLHIEASGSRRVIHENAPDLKQETSNSYLVSIDFNKNIGGINTGLLVEGFYTKLNNPFVNEFGTPDSTGTVVYTRVNARDGAIVKGVNMELNVVPSRSFSFTSGFTIQSSDYEAPQEFDTRHFFRTPDSYGYIAVDWDFIDNWCFSASGNYTGSMLVPYFGPTLADPEAGELRESDPFFDLGLKLSFDTKLNGATLQTYAGIKNLFNSYQSDFDIGPDRDPAYIYGPGQPRTIYLGVKVSNILN